MPELRVLRSPVLGFVWCLSSSSWSRFICFCVIHHHHPPRWRCQACGRPLRSPRVADRPRGARFPDHPDLKCPVNPGGGFFVLGVSQPVRIHMTIMTQTESSCCGMADRDGAFLCLGDSHMLHGTPPSRCSTTISCSPCSGHVPIHAGSPLPVPLIGSRVSPSAWRHLAAFKERGLSG